MFRCPDCGSPNTKVEGRPIIVEFDEEGPVAFSYDEDVMTNLPSTGHAECLNCNHSSTTEAFQVG